MSSRRLSHPGLKRVWNGLSNGRLAPPSTALLIVDLQRLTCDPALGLGARMRERGLDELTASYFGRIARAVRNARRLIGVCREAGVAVVYTHLASGTQDGRDVPELMHHHGLWARKGSVESEILSELAPTSGDLVLPRTVLSFFTPWVGDQILKNLGISTLVIAGVLTDGSIASTARDAGDRGYRTVVVENACAAFSGADHDAALEPIDLWYGRVAEADAVAQAIQRSQELF
jgi:ureidoacrylate peracid hydrolase